MDGVYQLFDKIKQAIGIPYNLKPEQCKILQLLLDSKNVLGILPTGFGKSVIYVAFIAMTKKVSLR